MKNLGFGMMRLPVLSGPTDFDYEQLNRMVDAFLDAGYTYFDTSYVYHNGKSEEATRKALVERHPRESFTVATKFPTFMLIPEEKIEETFQRQLDNLGVDYIDYYLLHNIQNVYYDGYDGKGGIVKTTHLFDHAKKWKEDGKIRHLGISFHSSAKLLDRVLTEHPEIEFVQIALNPIDWDSELVQAGPCYEVIRKHGRKVVIMEAVKGGGLARLPENAEAVLKAVHPDWSIASWSVRFCLEKEDVIAVLSGMSTLEQVLDNTKTANERAASDRRGEEGACGGHAALSRKRAHQAERDRAVQGAPVSRRSRQRDPAGLEHLPDPAGSRFFGRQQLSEKRHCGGRAHRFPQGSGEADRHHG